METDRKYHCQQMVKIYKWIEFYAILKMYLTLNFLINIMGTFQNCTNQIYSIKIIFSANKYMYHFVNSMSMGYKVSLFLNCSIEFDDCSTPGRPRCWIKKGSSASERWSFGLIEFSIASGQSTESTKNWAAFR